MKKTHAAVTKGSSAINSYREVVVGHKSCRFLIYFEWCMLLSPLPGALGILLRKVFWPRLFGSCGKGVVFGANIILRHPKRIHLADNIVISAGCILDARNEESDTVIVLDQDIMLSNYVILSCKNGLIKIGKCTGINAHTIIHSTNHCPVSIGTDVIIGPCCYIVGGGNYNTNRLDIPIWRQGNKNDGGVIMQNNIWLGANVNVLGGVTIESGSIAAAGSIINKSIPAMVVCAGQPAKVLKKRHGNTALSPIFSNQ